MTKAKSLPYAETPLDSWNTRHFQQYLADEHVKHYGITYVSKMPIKAEAGLIAQYIGTARKTGKCSKAVFKRFIDRCFAAYHPTPQYPGLSFWFMHTWMSGELQKAELDVKRSEEERSLVEQTTQEMEELSEWF